MGHPASLHAHANSCNMLRGTQITYSPHQMDKAQMLAVCDFLRQDDKSLQIKLCIIGKHGIGKTKLISKYISKKREMLNQSKIERIGTNTFTRKQSDGLISYSQGSQNKIGSHTSNAFTPIHLSSDKFNDSDDTYPANTNLRHSISDIEKLVYLYKNEYPVDVEIWDSVGLEKFNEMFMYSQNYIQGKQGVVFIVDSADFYNSVSVRENSEGMNFQGVFQENIKDLRNKINMLSQNCSVPVWMLFINCPSDRSHIDELINEVSYIKHQVNQKQLRLSVSYLQLCLDDEGKEVSTLINLFDQSIDNFIEQQVMNLMDQ